MFKPCGSNVVVKQLPIKQATDSGIIMYSSDEQRRRQMGENVGILIEVGPMAWEYVDDDGKPFTHQQAEVGDVVFFARYAGQQYTAGEIMEGKRGKDEPYYHLMPSADIMGVMPEDMAREYKQQRGVQE